MRGKKFKYVSHTADMAFVAKGDSIEDCIENACAALLNYMLDLERIKKNTAVVKSILIRESAGSPEYLTWFTLEHVLEEIDEKNLNAFELRVERFFEKGDKLNVYARLYYKAFDGDCTLMRVKAVTPHGMKMMKKGEEYSIKVIADV